MIWRRSHKKHEKETQKSKHLPKQNQSKEILHMKNIYILLKWGSWWQWQKACHCQNGGKTNDEANSNLVIRDLQSGPQGQIFPVIVVVNLFKVLKCKCSNILDIEMESSRWCYCVLKLHKLMPHWHLTRLFYFIHI